MSKELNIEKGKKCIYKYIDNQGVRFPCKYPALENEKYCIFHSLEVTKKAETFIKTLDLLISRIEDDYKIAKYDFKGFYFPKISFKKKVFKKELDLRGAVFSEYADFEGCQFNGELVTHKTIFKNIAFFQGAIFESNVSFIASDFNKLILIGGISKNKFVFHGCKFYENAVFQGRSFLNKVVFQSSIFYKDADFQRVKFQNKVDMRNTRFENRAIFSHSQFFDEVILSGANISYLKNISASGINFSGTILHSTNFYDTADLIDIDFRNAFLISCDLSNKIISNCDFTGAVFKAVHTDNSTIDEGTRQKTKYIFIDYELVEEIENGQTIERYTPKSNSRIPLIGNFGEGENKNFTLLEYLKEPHKWIFLLDLPTEVRTGILNYINFFKDFIKSTENYDVDIATIPEGDKTRVTILTKDENKKDRIEESFQNYIKNIFEPFNRLQIEFRNNEITEYDKNRFLINYNNELQTAQIRLQYGLQNQNDVDRTINTFGLLLQEKKDEINFYRKYILQSQNKETTQPNITVNVNQEANLTVHNVIEINFELAELLDELEKSNKDVNSHLIESLIDEIKEIKSELKNPQKVDSAKTKTKKVLSSLGKLADYAIKNYDTISKIGESLSKMF